MTPMAALTAGMNRSGATADLGPGDLPAARTTGPAGADRSAAVGRQRPLAESIDEHRGLQRGERRFL